MDKKIEILPFIRMVVWERDSDKDAFSRVENVTQMSQNDINLFISGHKAIYD